MRSKRCCRQPRLDWGRETGLKAAGARIRHFQNRWESRAAANVFQFHLSVIELAGGTQDRSLGESRTSRRAWSALAKAG